MFNMDAMIPVVSNGGERVRSRVVRGGSCMDSPIPSYIASMDAHKSGICRLVRSPLCSKSPTGAKEREPSSKEALI